MEERDPSAGEIARRGREIYERDIRREVEHEHDGEFLVVEWQHRNRTYFVVEFFDLPADGAPFPQKVNVFGG